MSTPKKKKCGDQTCGKLFQADKGFRNTCTKSKSYPFCSRECAERMYWKRDIHNFLRDFNRSV